MELIPYRTRNRKDWKRVYEFMFKPSVPTRENYIVEIIVDETSYDNDEIIETTCTCPGYLYKKTECKHIKESKRILNELNVLYRNELQEQDN